MNKDRNFDRVIAALPGLADDGDEEIHALEVAAAIQCGSLRLEGIDEAALESVIGLLDIDVFTEVASWRAESEPVPVITGTIDATVRESAEETLLGYFLRLLPQARDLIAQWVEQPSLRLLPQVAGEEVALDVRDPGPIYVSLLGTPDEAVWRSRLFTDEARVYPVSDGGAAVTFREGRVAVDISSLPADGRWRAFYLAQEHPSGCSEDERELYILGRSEPAKPQARDAVGKLVELILRGQVLDAWNNALRDSEVDDARLEVLVSMMFTQMEVLLGAAKADLLGNISEQALEKPLAADLKSLPRLLDSFKQVLSEAMRKRMGGDGVTVDG